MPLYWAFVSLKTIGSKNIHMLEWPSQSLILNPMNNLWKYLKTDIDRCSASNLTENQFKNSNSQKYFIDSFQREIK